MAILQQRPTAISQRLAEATQQREEASAQLQAPAADDASAPPVQARQWALETRYMALSTEIKMLDQELLTRSLRMQLLEAKCDKERASGDWIAERVKMLNELIGHKRRQTAEQAKVEAERTQRIARRRGALQTRMRPSTARSGVCPSHWRTWAWRCSAPSAPEFWRHAYLRCFVDSVELRFPTVSALNEAINDKLNAAGITIAFPQRDLHLDTIRPLRVQIEGDVQTN